MKNLIILSLLSFTSMLCSAQFSNNWLGTDNKHLLYSNIDLMLGNSSGGNLGMSFVYNCKYSVELGYSAISNQFNSIPLLKSGNKSEDTDNSISSELMDNFNLMVGRHFNLNKKKSIRFVVQGGPGISVLRETYNQQSSNFKNTEPAVVGKTNDFSLILNTKFEFPIIDILGFSAGPTLVMNHEKSYLTLSVGIMYGIISKE